jgi:nucleoside-diphosphate-sugar epimerase
MRVVVTGGSGKLGQHVVRELLGAGHDVLSLDRVAPPVPLASAWVVDLTHAGDAYQALRGADGVVHLAGWPAAGLTPDTETFGNNVAATYNVLKAATDLGADHIVLASSISAYGFSYAPGTPAPDYLPLDEDHPCTPRDPYGLSKLVAEQIAASCVRRRPLSVASLRIAGINFDLTYARFAERWRTPTSRLGSFWCYVDARDVAVACRLALEASLGGHKVFNVATPTSAMPEPTTELVRRYLPAATRLKDGLTGNWACMDSTKAARVLGWRAEHRWERYLPSDAPRPA